jgi:uncharacterized protein (DUF1697 family)
VKHYIAFLRAVNVAGHAVIRMSDLATVFESAGCANVRTYVQSGNVVFDAPEKSAPALFTNLRAALASRLGKEPGIVFRTVDELERLVKNSPFNKLKTAQDVKLYVVFLSAKPERAPRLPLMSEKEAMEAMAIKGLHVFMVSRPTKKRSHGFPNAFIEQELGVSATSRNWNTVTKIVAFARTSEPQ